MERHGDGERLALCACGAAHLTAREVQVLLLAAAGLGTRAIGHELRISPRTVEDHLAVMRKRVGARDSAELVARCYAAEVLLPGWPPCWSGRSCLLILQRPGHRPAAGFPGTRPVPAAVNDGARTTGPVTRKRVRAAAGWIGPRQFDNRGHRVSPEIRRAGALDAFQAIAKTPEEHGIDPGPRLRQVHQDILHDRAPGPPVRSRIPQRTQGGDPGTRDTGKPPGSPAVSLSPPGNPSHCRGLSVHSTGATATLIGYARCAAGKQDLQAQHQALRGLGVPAGQIYTDRGLTGIRRARPGLGQALAAVRSGDTLVVPRLDRLARSVPDARAIADLLAARGVKLSLGGSIYDPADPMGKTFFNTLATFAEFEADLLRMRTREGMAIARATGKLKGKPPKLTPRQQARLVQLHAAGNHTISDLAGMVSVSRATVYRVLARHRV